MHTLSGRAEAPSVSQLTSKPTSVEGVNRGGGGGDRGTLDVYVALRRLLVNKDVQDATVFVALEDDIVLDLISPVGGLLGRGVEHVGGEEALRCDGGGRLEGLSRHVERVNSSGRQLEAGPFSQLSHQL